MAVTFAVRGDSKNARYSTDGKTPGTVGTVTVEADATAIGGSRLNLYQGSVGKHQLKYVGRYNLPSANTFSLLVRYAVPFTGAPGANMGIFEFGADGAVNLGASGQYAYFGANHLTGSVINVVHFDESGTTGVNPATVKSAWSPTANQWYDLVWTYTGGTTNAIKFYIDGALASTTTTGSSWPNPRTQELSLEFTIGAGAAVSNSGFYVNEVVVWDTVIDPTSVTLTSGTGSLNGSSRTAFVDVISLDGRNSTNPGASNVRVSAGTYYINGVAYTASYTPTYAAASDVRKGTDRGDGTLGTCTVPVAATVLKDVPVDNTTGTLTLPNPAKIVLSI